MNPDESFQLLLKGNIRFTNKNSCATDQVRRINTLSEQNPFAIVLCCSDSRVPPEIIFDKRIGDLFVIRIAGNVIDDNVLGSIEYAVENLETSLIIVMGHENCGAIKSAVNKVKINNHIQSILDIIEPSVEQAREQTGDFIFNVTINNIKLMVEKIKSSLPVLSDHVKNGKLKIFGAYYSLNSGKVEFLS